MNINMNSKLAATTMSKISFEGVTPGSETGLPPSQSVRMKAWVSSTSGAWLVEQNALSSQLFT